MFMFVFNAHSTAQSFVYEPHNGNIVSHSFLIIIVVVDVVVPMRMDFELCACYSKIHIDTQTDEKIAHPYAFSAHVRSLRCCCDCEKKGTSHTYTARPDKNANEQRRKRTKERTTIDKKKNNSMSTHFSMCIFSFARSHDAQTHVEMRGSPHTCRYSFFSFIRTIIAVFSSRSGSFFCFFFDLSICFCTNAVTHLLLFCIENIHTMIHTYCLRLCIDERVSSHTHTHKNTLHPYHRVSDFSRVWINLCKHQNYVVEFELSTCSVRKEWKLNTV